MTNDSQGEIGRAICLQDTASKGKSGRMIPISEELRNALIEYRKTVPHAGPYVINTERALATSPQAIVNLFQRWYRHLGFEGCSSHSGRRTFITNAARKISTSADRCATFRPWRGTVTSARLRGTLTRILRRMRGW
jgi:integrase/recombinase XerD